VGTATEIEACYRRIIRQLGEDSDREGLLRTPERAARALIDLTAGYREDLRTIVNGAIFESESDEMIMVRNIETYSLCEHHLLPFIGQCHVAYIPDGKIIGLSKIPRIVNHYARRLQIQERLTTQVAKAVQQIVGARGVGVVVEASHLCVMMRGVEKQHSQMKTSCMLGSFRGSASTRSEFLQLLGS
jgi:GTP cyclohydrolase I